MSILINKLTALTLASTIGAVSLGTVAYASPSHNSQNQTSITQKVNNQGSYSKFNEQAFIKLMQPYIKVENNKYVIDASIYENSQISAHDINLLREMLNRSNKTLDKLSEKYRIKDLSVKDGFVLNKTSENNNGFAIIANGINAVHFYWWGMYIYLNSDVTQCILNGGVEAGAAAVGAVIGDVPGAIIGAVVGAIIDTLSINTTEAQDGCVVSYNYIEGIQQIWAQ